MDIGATEPGRRDVWLPLSFEHDQTDDHSSYLTNVRKQPTLYCHRTGHAWVNILFPDVYYGNLLTCEPHRGLKGGLPIFLALLAFSCLRTSCKNIFLHCHIVASGKYTTRHTVVSASMIDVFRENLSTLPRYRRERPWGKSFYNSENHTRQSASGLRKPENAEMLHLMIHKKHDIPFVTRQQRDRTSRVQGPFQLVSIDPIRTASTHMNPSCQMNSDMVLWSRGLPRRRRDDLAIGVISRLRWLLSRYPDAAALSKKSVTYQRHSGACTLK